MTGHFPARYNIDGHFAWVPSNAKRNMPDWLDADCITLPRLLQGAGYATAHFGKWHLANDMIPDSPSPGEYGYDAYGAFNCSGEQMPVHDIVTDAYEKKDLKDSHPEVVAQLKQKLTAWKSTLPAKPNPKNFSSLRKNSAP